MSTIVLATDLSEEARSGATWAFDWARRQPEGAARVVVVHVVTAEELVIKRVIFERSEDGELNELTAEVGKWLEPHLGEGVPVEIEVHAGSVVDGLTRACKSHDADWLVLSMSGKGAFGRLLLGSTASRIVHRPPCPTFIVHPEPLHTPDAPHIVAAVDFSPTSFDAAVKAAELARLLGGRLSLVHVIEIPRLVPAMSDSGMYPQTISAHIEETTRWATGELEAFVDKHVGVFVGLDPKLEVLPGYPAQEIIAYAKDEAADVLVVGNAGRSALGDFLMGSVATRVVHAAPSTLLIIAAAPTASS